MLKVEILKGNTFERIKEIPDNSVDLIITSPPYWGVRQYPIEKIIIADNNCQHEWISEYEGIVEHCSKCNGFKGYYGMEKSLEDYLNHSLIWIKECFRVLKDSGSFVLNVGGFYLGCNLFDEKSAERSIKSYSKFLETSNFSEKERNRRIIDYSGYIKKKIVSFSFLAKQYMPKGHIYKEKQYISLESFFYQKIIYETDFICRGIHIWYKKNALPLNYLKRPNHVYESFLWFVKSSKNYINKNAFKKDSKYYFPKDVFSSYVGSCYLGLKKEDYKDKAHVCSFPEEVIFKYINMLCPYDGTVLDVFAGIGTVNYCAYILGINNIAIELSDNYVYLLKKRVNWKQGINVEYVER